MTKPISFISPVHGNPIALKKTLDSFKGICDEFIIGDLVIFPDDRALIESYKDEFNLKIIKLPFNDLFIHGFSKVLNKLASHATNPIVLYMNVGEVIDGEFPDQNIGEPFHAWAFDHATDQHRWYRMFDRNKLHFSGRIHEEIRDRNGDGLPVKYCPTPVFRMKDEPKDSEDMFKAFILDECKDIVYLSNYLKLVDEPESQGATNPGWVIHAKDGYENIKQRVEARGDLLTAFITGDEELLQSYIIREKDSGKWEPQKSSKLVNMQSDGHRVGNEPKEEQ